MDTWFVSAFWLLWIMLLWLLMWKYLFESLVSFIFCTYPGVELLDWMVNLCLIFFELPCYFPQWQFTFSPVVYTVSSCSTFTPTLYFLFLFCFYLRVAMLMIVKGYLIVLLSSVSLIINDVQHPFVYFLAIYIPLEKCLLKSLFPHFWIGLFSLYGG